MEMMRKAKCIWRYIPECWAICSLDCELLRTEEKCSGRGLVVGSFVYVWCSCMS